MPIGDRSVGPGGWMRPPTERLNWRRFLKREYLKPAVGVVILLVLVFGAIYLYSRHKSRRAKSAETAPAALKAPSTIPEAPKTAEIDMPGDLGGHVNSEALVRLLNAAHQYDLNTARLRLTLEGRGTNHTPVFPIGESFKVKISSASECYYGLVHHNSDGTFQLLLPQSDSGSKTGGKLKTGVTMELTVHATPPGGQQEFVLICAPRPIDLQSVLSGPQEAYKPSLSVAVFPYVAQEAK